jgi:hypothetical protein
MSAWLDRLLSKIQPERGQIQIALDPDGVLLDEITLSLISERRFTVLPWQDEIAFRLDYETRFRSKWDADENAESNSVLLHFSGDSLEDLPWDIVNAAYVHRLSLAELFPDMALAVVRKIPIAVLGQLYDRYIAKRPGPLGENATADFALLNAYKIADTLIETHAELLRLLLDLHFRQVSLPEVLIKRLVMILGNRSQFSDWPLVLLFSDRTAFLTFIEERWPIAIDDIIGIDEFKIKEGTTTPYLVRVPGPLKLPFADISVRTILDNLFAEGMVPRLERQDDITQLPEWMKVGVVSNNLDDQIRQIDHLLTLLSEKLPNDDARYGDWVRFGWSWAEVVLSWNALPLDQQPQVAIRFRQLQQVMDERFVLWLKTRYGSLASLPSINSPVMGHHVAQFLSRKVAAGRKVALIVMDGMAMDQWLLLQHELESGKPAFDFERDGVFTWMPTLTSIARQAIFAGLMPRSLKNLKSTQGEPSVWQTFWSSHGLNNQAVGYIKGIQQADHLPEVEELASGSQIKVLGLVVDAIDEMMHGMTLGSRGMHCQVTSWAEQRVLPQLFDSLLNQDFEIYVTADHGNIEAKGIGRVSQGAMAETRGERVRIYDDLTLIQKTASDVASLGVIGNTAGLPSGMYPFYAAGRTAFTQTGVDIVAHGGMCIEELIVPFINVKRKFAV